MIWSLRDWLTLFFELSFVHCICDCSRISWTCLCCRSENLWRNLVKCIYWYKYDYLNCVIYMLLELIDFNRIGFWLMIQFGRFSSAVIGVRNNHWICIRENGIWTLKTIEVIKNRRLRYKMSVEMIVYGKRDGRLEESRLTWEMRL